MKPKSASIKGARAFVTASKEFHLILKLLDYNTTANSIYKEQFVAVNELYELYISELIQNMDASLVQRDEPLCAHTTFEIGGVADVFVTPESIEDIKAAVQCAKKHGLSYFVLGKGSDLLVSDEGYRGVVISLTEAFSYCYVQDSNLVASAGATLKDVCELACFEGLSGLEFACGIPGSVGGGCFMNAGAYGGQLSDVLSSVTCMKEDGSICTYRAEELDFGYRQSKIKSENLIALEAVFTLKPENPVRIRQVMDEFTALREVKQPLEYASAGSTFKRPEGYFAGKLIQDAGLQGYSVGNAQVSTKHAGFVINTGGATASEVYQLIKHIQRTVLDVFGVEIRPEVRFIGDFSRCEDIV